MRIYNSGLSAAILVGAMLAAAPAARADYMFSGTGASGALVAASETWEFNSDGGAGFPGHLNNWGSPGVAAGLATYGEASPAYGMVITFDGGSINAPSIAIGNGAACFGSTEGGTTFCKNSPTLTADMWRPFQTGPGTIQFLAQDSSFRVSQNQQYFVNVFFDGPTPTGFTGRWLTDFTPDPVGVPEPSSLALLALGLAGIGLGRRRERA